MKGSIPFISELLFRKGDPMEFHFKTNSKTSNENTSPASSEEFPCPAIFLPILENEYNQERTRTERIDNKAMALLTIIIALITVYVPIFPFKDLVQFYSNNAAHCMVLSLFSLFPAMGMGAILLAISSARKLTAIYKPTKFQAVNIELLNSNEKLSQNPVTPFQLEIIDHYQSIILSNSKINSQKAEILNKQFKNAIINICYRDINFHWYKNITLRR